MTKLLIIDNFDSFTYNLYQRLRELECEVEVKRNNAITLQQIRAGNYDGLVLSPGPGTPEKKEDFGVCADVIRELGPSSPILGVCLGHQGIIHSFGGKIVRAPRPRHGKTSQIEHEGRGLFEGLPNPLTVMRYHSLVGEEASLPSCLRITARSLDDKQVMGVQHEKYPMFGVQFHPESIMAQDGLRLLGNFRAQCKR
ncbi:Anthranilate synthase component 2 [uncultured archaeon]|nr:Anthranilate synthase component 2 [uncultured archaeon]